jgi:hypothetical protein
MRSKTDTMRKIVCAMLPLLAALVILPCAVRAEEGAAGHYGPGSMASFFDAFPPRPGDAAVFTFYTHYEGDASAAVQIPVAGLATFGLDASSDVVTVGAFYRSKLHVLDGGLAFGAALPFLWVDAQATVSGDLGSVDKMDDASGLGDIAIYPLMLGWVRQGGDLRYDFRLGVFTPTGSYENKKLANLGKNFWTFEPGFMLSYLGRKNGREASVYAGFDFNTKNTETDYQSGATFHVDATVAQHLPLFGRAIGLGATGFYYQQISDDDGFGAIALNGFRGRTVGVGPVLSLMRLEEGSSLICELKWLPELDTDNRLEGDFIWFKAAVAF